MATYWISCGSENLHIIGTCPNCFATESGLLLGTAATGYAGKITANCTDCGKIVDYYVDATVQKIWRLEPVESRRVFTQQQAVEQEGSTAP